MDVTNEYQGLSGVDQATGNKIKLLIVHQFPESVLIVYDINNGPERISTEVPSDRVGRFIYDSFKILPRHGLDFNNKRVRADLDAGLIDEDGVRTEDKIKCGESEPLLKAKKEFRGTLIKCAIDYKPQEKLTIPKNLNMYTEWVQSPEHYTVFEPQFFNPKYYRISLPKWDPTELKTDHIDNTQKTVTTSTAHIQDTTPLMEVVARLATRLAIELVETGKAKENVREVTELLLLAERYCKS